MQQKHGICVHTQATHMRMCQTFTHARAHTRTHAHIHTNTHNCASTCAITHIHSRTKKLSHTQQDTQIGSGSNDSTRLVTAVPVSNTFSRESPKLQTHFHVSKRSPRHSKDLNLSDLEIQIFSDLWWSDLLRERSSNDSTQGYMYVRCTTWYSICTFACARVHVCVCACWCTFVWICIYMYINSHNYICTCTRVCMCVCVCTCVCVWVFNYILFGYKSTWIQIFTHKNIYTCVYVYTYVYLPTYIDR